MQKPAPPLARGLAAGGAGQPGSLPPQKLVSERAEYYSQLKQRGFKGPGLPQSELTGQGKSKKLAASK